MSAAGWQRSGSTHRLLRSVSPLSSPVVLWLGVGVSHGWGIPIVGCGGSVAEIRGVCPGLRKRHPISQGNWPMLEMRHMVLEALIWLVYAAVPFRLVVRGTVGFQDGDCSRLVGRADLCHAHLAPGPAWARWPVHVIVATLLASFDENIPMCVPHWVSRTDARPGGHR